jgi:hypothetical protein
MAVVLGTIALVSVLGSFALAALTLSRALPDNGHQANPEDRPESAAATMARVLEDLAQLANLRERGALTAKEFDAQKKKCLDGEESVDVPATR